MNRHGKMNILWDDTKDYEEAPNVEEWVSQLIFGIFVLHCILMYSFFKTGLTVAL